MPTFPLRGLSGNRRERVFFSDADYELYRDLLGEACARERVAVWSYCLQCLSQGVQSMLVSPESELRAVGSEALPERALDCLVWRRVRRDR